MPRSSICVACKYDNGDYHTMDGLKELQQWYKNDFDNVRIMHCWQCGYWIHYRHNRSYGLMGEALYNHIKSLGMNPLIYYKYLLSQQG